MSIKGVDETVYRPSQGSVVGDRRARSRYERSVGLDTMKVLDAGEVRRQAVHPDLVPRRMRVLSTVGNGLQLLSTVGNAYRY